MTDYTDVAERLRVKFLRARGMLNSFYVELAEATNTMTPEEYRSWCFTNMRISATVINTMAGVLAKADARRVRDELRFREKKPAAPKKPTVNAAYGRNRVQKARDEAKRAEAMDLEALGLL